MTVVKECSIFTPTSCTILTPQHSYATPSSSISLSKFCDKFNNNPRPIIKKIENATDKNYQPDENSIGLIDQRISTDTHPSGIQPIMECDLDASTVEIATKKPLALTDQNQPTIKKQKHPLTMS
jgi:hypothetical protein